MKYFNVYLQGVHFELQTDNSALTWLLKMKETTPRLIRWALVVQGYDFTVKHTKGKHNVVPDALSRKDYPYSHTKENDDLDAFPDLSCILVNTKATQTSSFDLDHTNPVSEVTKTRHVQFSPLLHVTFYYDPEVAVQSNTTPDTHVVSSATNIDLTLPADSNAINTTLEPDSVQSATTIEHLAELSIVTRPDAPITLPAAMRTRIKCQKDKLHGTVVATADQPLQTLDLTPATIHCH